MKIISSKEYKKLKEYKHKYNLLIGEEFTYFVTARSKRSALLQYEKEELVKIIFDLNSRLVELTKMIEKSGKQ